MNSRHWCLTIFEEYSTEDVQTLFSLREDVRYWILQRERCPTTEKLHYQCYVEFKGNKRLSGVKKIFGQTVHAEPRKRPRDNAREYCRKAETRVCGPWEGGVWQAGQGTRTDLAAIKARLDEGATEKEIADEHFEAWVRYNKAFNRYKSLGQPRRDFKTELHILWGAPGTGKTMYIYDNHERDEIYPLPRPNGGSVWFDGLTTQKVIIIDDFYGWIPIHLLLILADRYPAQVATKGGHTQFLCTHLYITSNKPPEEWYRWDELGQDLWGAFKRRITTRSHYPDPAMLGFRVMQ